MIYLVGQIVFWLILAVIFGFFLGWYFRGVGIRMKETSSEDIPSKKPVEKEVKVASPVEAERKVDHKDDLKRIKGIGPFLEKKLNELGIQTFKQIAQWDIDDISKISDQLEHFPKRVERDNWIEQAKKLHEK